MFPVYHFLMGYLSDKLSREIHLTVGADYREIFHADLTFICGLPYVLYTQPYATHSAIEALVAPVLRGERFQNRPVYFSDVIVHRDSPFNAFSDLRGCTWAYNEEESQSGYGITRYWLTKMGETNGYFREVIRAGFHQKSIRLVCQREVDASAIDAQVFAIELRDHPQLAEQLRVIDSLGPSTIQPFAAATHLPLELKQEIQTIFVGLHQDPTTHPYLNQGLIDHFTMVSDADYNDIRQMFAACKQADFLQLK